MPILVFNEISIWILVKVDREKQIIVIDEHLEAITVEELQVKLDHHNHPHSRFDKFHCMTHAIFILGAITIASAKIHRLFLQNDSRRFTRFIPYVLHLLHAERFDGKLAISVFR